MKRTITFFDIFNGFLMVLVLVAVLYPFLYAASYSLSRSELIKGGLLLLPKGFTLASYILCIGQRDVLSGFLVSVGRTILGPLSMLLFVSMAAYVLTKNDYLGVRFFRKFFVFTMYFSGGIIPTYILMKTLHLTNNFLVYILPMIINVFNLVLVKTYIESMPKELEEAAYMDGANELVIYSRIVLPLSMPILAAVAFIAAMNHWNSFVDTLLYNSMNRRLYTLQFVLYNLIVDQTRSVQEAQTKFSAGYVTPETLKMSLTVISILPILLVYPFAQKYFVSGLMVGSIKG